MKNIADELKHYSNHVDKLMGLMDSYIHLTLLRESGNLLYALIDLNKSWRHKQWKLLWAISFLFLLTSEVKTRAFPGRFQGTGVNHPYLCRSDVLIWLGNWGLENCEARVLIRREKHNNLFYEIAVPGRYNKTHIKHTQALNLTTELILNLYFTAFAQSKFLTSTVLIAITSS